MWSVSVPLATLHAQPVFVLIGPRLNPTVPMMTHLAVCVCVCLITQSRERVALDWTIQDGRK